MWISRLNSKKIRYIPIRLGCILYFEEKACHWHNATITKLPPVLCDRVYFCFSYAPLGYVFSQSINNVFLLPKTHTKYQTRGRANVNKLAKRPQFLANQIKALGALS